MKTAFFQHTHRFINNVSPSVLWQDLQIYKNLQRTDKFKKCFHKKKNNV